MANDQGRRNVLKGLGGLAVIGATGAKLMGSAVAASLDDHISAIPATPNRTLPLQERVYGYAEKSVEAGETINFRVSSPAPYRLTVRRLGWHTDGPGPLDWPIHEFPVAPAAARGIYPGSYIHVEKALASSAQYASLSLECWVRVFYCRNWRGLITQHTSSAMCGFGLFLDDAGYPHAYFGDGGAYSSAWDLVGKTQIQALERHPPSEWYHIAAVFEKEFPNGLEVGVAKLYVNGVLEARSEGHPLTVVPGPAPLRIGAYGAGQGTDYFLNGDIAMPAIYNRALSLDEIRNHFSTGAGPSHSDAGLLGHWPLGEETGSEVQDVSAYARTGLIVNRGAWMIGGPKFDALLIDRFGNYDPSQDQSRGHSLRLSDADLFSCSWPTTQSYQLPEDAVSGVYVGRVTSDIIPKPYDITFIVRAPSSKRSSVLVLCATNTWLAYEGEAFGLGNLYVSRQDQGHESGQDFYYVGMEVPWEGAGAYVVDGKSKSPDPNYGHRLRAERHMHTWLEKMAINYDVISDQDLDTMPAVLGNYKLVVICGHSEYWSVPAYAAVEAYLNAGGRVVSASGNTMCWRVTYDDGVMECRRKVPGHYNEMYGEHYHEHDGQVGGSLRQVDCPAWKLIGLDTVSYGNQAVPYKVALPEHQFFLTPDPVAVQLGDVLGGPFAVGHEYDATLHQIPQGGGLSKPSIPNDYSPVVLAHASSFDFPDLPPDSPRPNRLRYDLEFAVPKEYGVVSEIIDWERAEGGRVLAIGSINAGYSLHADPNMSTMFRNGLHHLGIVDVVNVMAVDANGALRNRWLSDGTWWPINDWQHLGTGFSAGKVVGIQGASGTVSVIGVNQANRLLYVYWNGTQWSNWLDMGINCRSVAASSSGRNQLDIFVRGVDDRIHRMSWDGVAWAPWVDMGGLATSDPSAVICHGRESSVAFLGASGNVLYQTKYQGAYTGAWQDMGGVFAHGPTMFWWDSKLFVFAVAASGTVSFKYWDGTSWVPSLSSWQAFGGNIASRVQVANMGPSLLGVFGTGTDGHLKVAYLDLSSGVQVSGWSDLGGSLVGEPSIATFRGQNVCVTARGLGGTILSRSWNGTDWGSWVDLGGSMISAPSIYRSLQI